MSPRDFNLDRPSYSINELAKLLSIGRTTLYAYIKSGILKTTKIGNRTLVLAPDIVTFLMYFQSMTQGEKS